MTTGAFDKYVDKLRSILGRGPVDAMPGFLLMKWFNRGIPVRRAASLVVQTIRDQWEEQDRPMPGRAA